jgi:hypothetical protein
MYCGLHFRGLIITHEIPCNVQMELLVERGYNIAIVITVILEFLINIVEESCYKFVI